MWLPVDGSDAPKIPSGKDKRLIVLHALWTVRLITQRSKSSRVFFLSFGLLDSGGPLPFTTLYTEL
jgi:hypothetical protein